MSWNTISVSSGVFNRFCSHAESNESAYRIEHGTHRTIFIRRTITFEWGVVKTFPRCRHNKTTGTCHLVLKHCKWSLLVPRNLMLKNWKAFVFTMTRGVAFRRDDRLLSPKSLHKKPRLHRMLASVTLMRPSTILCATKVCVIHDPHWSQNLWKFFKSGWRWRSMLSCGFELLSNKEECPSILLNHS